MIVNVQMNDGHTQFQFASRGDLNKVMGQEPADTRSVVGWAKWHPENDWVETRLTFIRKHSIAFVVAAEDVAETGADLPAKAVADKRLTAWQAREAAAEQEPVAA